MKLRWYTTYKMNFKNLLSKAYDNSLSHEEAKEYAKENQQTLVEFANTFALYLAKSYDENSLNFDFCDGAMNWLYGFMLEDEFLESCNYKLPIADDIYLAFDAGEYKRSEDDENINPIEKYTNPEIKRILKEYDDESKYRRNSK